MSILDVALRLRLINQTKAPAREAGRDLHSVETAARRLNGARGGERLTQELRKVTGEAKKATDSVDRLNRSTRALGSARPGAIGAGVGAGGGASGGLGLAGGVAAARAARIAAASTEVGAGLGISGAALGVTAASGVAAGGIIATGLALKGAVSEAISFEDAMAEVRKAVDLTPDSLRALEREILKISRVTPLAKEEIAQLVAQAGFAGRPADELVRFGTFAAKAAVAFGMSAEEAGDALAKMGNVFGLTQAGIEQLGDAINTLGDNTASKERDIVSFLQRVGAQAKTFGLAESEAAAFGATMLSLGTTSEVAGTGFNALLTKLQTASKQNKGFQGGLKALGLTAKQVGALIKKGPAEAIVEVLTRIEKLPSDKKAGVLMDLFGLEYADDAARLAGSIKQIAEALQMVRDKAKAQGSVDRAFSIFDETTSSKIKKLGNQMAALGTRIGQAFTPIIGAAADALGGLLEKINSTLDRAAEVKALSEKLNGGGQLDAQDRARLGGDPELNRQFQTAVAKGQHPLIGAVQRQLDLEAEVAAGEKAAAGGDIGAQNRLIALRAALSQVKAEVESALKVPGAADAVTQSMRAVTDAVKSEGEEAVQAAQSIADRIRALFNFNVAPTISPQFAPSGSGGGSAPLPPLPPKQKVSAAGGPQNVTFHITGSDPEATALAVERRLARLGNTAGALYDTA